MSYFVTVKDQAGKLTSFINLDQVRMITDIGPNGCVLHLGANFKVNIVGEESAKELLTLVTRYSALAAPPEDDANDAR